MLHYYYRIICLEKDDSCGCDYGQKKKYWHEMYTSLMKSHICCHLL